MELSILFVMAVILLRGFFLEGYLISTGSMAPGLLGLHKQITCPSCQYGFAFGVTFDDSVDHEEESADVSRNYATCPNCGQANINAGNTPANHGDQLLVHKGVFDVRRPVRWEAVVFRNPASPGEAYLKRVVGLPGEHLQVIDGDLFIEGAIARKDYQTQKEMRIPFFDMNHTASMDGWQIPWKISGRWQLVDGRLSCDGKAPNTTAAAATGIQVSPNDTDNIDWLQFQHWRWSGGNHYSEVPLLGDDVEADWQNCVNQMQGRPISWMTRLEFNRERMVLRLRGVMPYQMQSDLISWADSTSFRQAVYRLAALSHLSPVTDRYGYNSLVSSPEYPVRDLMLEVDMQWANQPSLFAVRVPVDGEVFRVELNMSQRTCRLVLEGTEKTIRETSLNLPPETNGASKGQLKIEVSNFDHRLSAAVNGVVVFEPLDIRYVDTDALGSQMASDDASFSATTDDAQKTAKFVSQQNRWALGVSGGDVAIDQVKMYRDVHYTPGRRKNGVDSPHLVSENAYFVQGDNSPVSSDSRSWPNPDVPHKLLVGKPFVVHLPSKPGKVTIGGLQLPIRIPDFGRIRYIR